MRDRFDRLSLTGALVRGLRVGVAMLFFALVLGALSLLASGCANPIGGQARAATVSAAALTAGGDAVMAARSAALDRVEAEHPTDPEHDLALDAEAARWLPVLEGLDAGRTALLVWIDALELAQAAGGDDDLLPPLLALGLRTLRLIADAFALASSLGVEGLPVLPALGGE
jgi:hypothetical protein